MRRVFNNSLTIRLEHGCWVTNLELKNNIVNLKEELAIVQSTLDQITCEAMGDGLKTNGFSQIRKTRHTVFI